MVREIHGHHEQRRRKLQETHGIIYDDFENVHTQLNALSAELNALTEHGVALDANFSKYGYDAHLSKPKMDFTYLLGGGFDLVTYRNSKCGLFCEFNDSLFSRTRQA